mgnify:CR=1 FL=1
MGILIFKTDKTKWQKMLIALLGLFFLTTAIAGGNMNFRSGKNDSDVSRLAHAKVLESKLIGEEGSKSKQSNSFERLNKERNRDKFKKLYHESENIHGKIYALIWFFDNDKNLYGKYKNELNKNEEVIIYHADIIVPSPLADVFPMIESGYLKKHILY